MISGTGSASSPPNIYRCHRTLKLGFRFVCSPDDWPKILRFFLYYNYLLGCWLNEEIGIVCITTALEFDLGQLQRPQHAIVRGLDEELVQDVPSNDEKHWWQRVTLAHPAHVSNGRFLVTVQQDVRWSGSEKRFNPRSLVGVPDGLQFLKEQQLVVVSNLVLMSCEIWCCKAFFSFAFKMWWTNNKKIFIWKLVWFLQKIENKFQMTTKQ